MSENYKFYMQRISEMRAANIANHPLLGQLLELLHVVEKCESRWAVEDRISHSFRNMET